MSQKSQAGHVDIDNDPLPSPLTTRNLRPRLSQSLARVAYRDASRSERSSSGHSSQRTTPRRSNTPAMQSNVGASSSSTSNAGPSSGKQSTESSGSAARTRKRQAKRKRVMTPEDITTLEEVEQLRSSDSDDIPIAQSISSGMGAQSASGPSCSAHRSDPSHVSNLSSSPEPIASTSSAPQDFSGTSPPEPEPLADYTCPICFFPPTNATLTPCGHICCGSCLFMAVKSTLQRGTLVNNADANVARCPVCRAPIPGWDGRGGGVIGLKARTLFSL